MNKNENYKATIRKKQLRPPGRNHTVEVLKSPDPSQPVNKTETNKKHHRSPGSDLAIYHRWSDWPSGLRRPLKP